MPRRNTTTFTPKQDSEIFRMRRAGATFTEIGKAVGVSGPRARYRFRQLQKAIAQAKAEHGSGNPVIDEINCIEESRDGSWNAPMSRGSVAREICVEHNKALRGVRATLEAKLRLEKISLEKLQEKYDNLSRSLNTQIEQLEAQRSDLEKQVQSLQHENDQLRANVGFTRSSHLPCCSSVCI